MTKRILLDLIKCRDCKVCNSQCSYLYHPGNNGMRSLREYASFLVTCRRCEDAPCVSVCPVEALEKDSTGIISRNPYLCVACKSCVAICPFGTLMSDFFETRNSVCDFCNFDDDTRSLKCMDTCSERAISFTEIKRKSAENLHLLNKKVLIRDYSWKKLKKEL